jgi:hypothetical protein
LNLPSIILPASVTLGFPTNSIRLQPTVLIGTQVAPTNSFNAQWRVVTAPGTVLFSSSNSVNPQVTFGARGTNEIELTVTANGAQTNARVLVILSPDSSGPSQSYSNWIAGFSNIPPSAASPGNDADGDGLSNAEEFLFARDPTQAQVSPVILINAASNGVVISYPQRKGLPPDCYYVIETKSSLSSPGTWQPAPGIEFQNIGDLGDSVQMNAFVPASGASQAYFRFRIVLNP